MRVAYCVLTLGAHGFLKLAASSAICGLILGRMCCANPGRKMLDITNNNYNTGGTITNNNSGGGPPIVNDNYGGTIDNSGGYATTSNGETPTPVSQNCNAGGVDVTLLCNILGVPCPGSQREPGFPITQAAGTGTCMA
jgi:hypothetical protein